MLFEFLYPEEIFEIMLPAKSSMLPMCNQVLQYFTLRQYRVVHPFLDIAIP
jgi:hypothetical protein